jgi:DNA-binding response OmpR family regulator
MSIEIIMLGLLAMDAKRILLIDDERDIRALFKRFLNRHGYIVELAKDGKSGLALIKKTKFDLILLDLMLPDSFGADICKSVRSMTTTPILILTASNSDLHYIKSLESGADDFVQKSSNTEVVLEKIKAILRRVLTQKGELIVENVDFEIATFDGWRFMPKTNTLVTPDKINIYLTNHENKLLTFLVRSENVVIARETIAEWLGLSSKKNIIGTVDTLVCRFRQKIKYKKDAKEFIETVRGKGYKMSAKVEYET